MLSINMTSQIFINISLHTLFFKCKGSALLLSDLIYVVVFLQKVAAGLFFLNNLTFFRSTKFASFNLFWYVNGIQSVLTSDTSL